MAIKRHGRELSPKEQVAYAMRLTGWTREQYRKEYDRLRFKVRAYERTVGVGRSGPINVADLLIRNEFNKKIQGSDYQPTDLYRAVSAAPVINTSRALPERKRQQVIEAEFERVDKLALGLYKSRLSEEFQEALKDYSAKDMASVQAYRNLVESYLDRLDKMRRDFAKENSERDPWNRQEWES